LVLGRSLSLRVNTEGGSRITNITPFRIVVVTAAR
jgi:hypothetical protein